MKRGKDFDHDGERMHVQIEHVADDRYRVRVGEREHEVTAARMEGDRVRLRIGDSTFEVAAGPVQTGEAARRRGDVHVSLGASSYVLNGGAAGRGGEAHVAGDGVIVAPMTGTVLSISVAVGDAVSAADTVAVVSAMKMEHKLVAGVDGTVAEVGAEEGAAVEQDHVLLRIDPAS